MSAKHLTLRRLVTGIVLSMLLVGMMGVAPVSAEEGVGLSDGTVLSGDLTVWEDASQWPASAIYVGYPDPSVGFTVDSTTGHNAWGPYSTPENALDGACRTASNRLTNDGFTAVTVNGTPFTDVDSCKKLDLIGNAPEGTSSADSGSDSNASLEDSMKLVPKTATQEGTPAQPMVMDPGTYDPATLAENGIECMSAESAAAQQQASGSGTASIYDNDAVTELPNGGVAIPTGLAVPAGICVNDGIVVVRAVRVYGVGGVEDVFAMDLDPAKGGVYCGKHGETGYDCWWNYPTTDAAVYASCEVAQGDEEAAQVEGNYIYQGAVVTYFGGPVPTVCK